MRPLDATRPARVMNVRRPEWDEHPSRPVVRNAFANQFTMLTAVILAPRCDVIIGPTAAHIWASRRQARHVGRDEVGIRRPALFLAA